MDPQEDPAPSCLRGLQELDLTGCEQVADMGVSWLALHLTDLTVLSLSECPVTDMCLPFFSRLGSLRELCLRACHGITDDGLRHLVHLTSLQELHLGCCSGPEGEHVPRVTAVGLKHLVAITSLAVLSLEGCRDVTPEAAQLLLSHSASLVALDLRNTNVPRSFAEEVVRPLALTRRLNVKLGPRGAVDGPSDIFDVVGRPLYKHCVNLAHDWTGACHEQPCECSSLWNRSEVPAMQGHTWGH